MKILTLTIFSLFLILPAFGQSSKGNVQVVPLVGYERVQKVTPTPRSVDRAFVGVRLIYGPPLLAAEAEVTRSSDTENLPASDFKEEEESYAAKLGLRSSFNFLLFRWYLRAGGHARKSEITRTQNGVTTVLEPGIKISPYAGTGLSFRVANHFFLSAGVTAIFTGEPKGSDREYQTSLGFGMRF